MIRVHSRWLSELSTEATKLDAIDIKYGMAIAKETGEAVS